MSDKPYVLINRYYYFDAVEPMIKEGTTTLTIVEFDKKEVAEAQAEIIQAKSRASGITRLHHVTELYRRIDSVSMVLEKEWKTELTDKPKGKYVLVLTVKPDHEDFDKIVADIKYRRESGDASFNYELYIDQYYTIEQVISSDYLFYIHTENDKIVKICVYSIAL